VSCRECLLPAFGSRSRSLSPSTQPTPYGFDRFVGCRSMEACGDVEAFHMLSSKRLGPPRFVHASERDADGNFVYQLRKYYLSFNPNLTHTFGSVAIQLVEKNAYTVTLLPMDQYAQPTFVAPSRVTFRVSPDVSANDRELFKSHMLAKRTALREDFERRMARRARVKREYVPVRVDYSTRCLWFELIRCVSWMRRCSSSMKRECSCRRLSPPFETAPLQTLFRKNHQAVCIRLTFSTSNGAKTSCARSRISSCSRT
jgi:hypothetical protein